MREEPTHQAADLGAKVARLRDLFDKSFALPPPLSVTGRVRLLAIRVADSPCALRLAALASVTLNRKIVPLPGAVPELSGLMGLGGRMVAVYSLAALLFPGKKDSPEAWVAQCGEDPSVGLSFAEFSGHLEAEPESFQRTTSAGARQALVREFVEHGSDARAVIDLPSVLAAIRSLGGGTSLDFSAPSRRTPGRMA